MNYQLVLQFRGELLADFDAMMKLEDELSVHLKDIAEVDGHDMGCGEMNIFILTSDPLSVFERAKPSLERHKLLADVKAGFRPLSDDTYTAIWPENSTGECLVA
jgi:hypothetical protein